VTLEELKKEFQKARDEADTNPEDDWEAGYIAGKLSAFDFVLEKLNS
jgi:hypothetical protein